MVSLCGCSADAWGDAVRRSPEDTGSCGQSRQRIEDGSRARPDGEDVQQAPTRRKIEESESLSAPRLTIFGAVALLKIGGPCALWRTALISGPSCGTKVYKVRSELSRRALSLQPGEDHQQPHRGVVPGWMGRERHGDENF